MAYNPHSQQALAVGHISVLAQAKPAIIGSKSGDDLTITTGVLSERINSALKLSPNNGAGHKRNAIFDLRENKMKHIEDETTIHKQNASNQMRQAAVIAAAASQQKIRLSASERLAMTAKRPLTVVQQQQQQMIPPTQHNPNKPNDTFNTNTNSINSKLTPLPTLETLLAVQRQLQKHTKQHLNSAPRQQEMVITNNADNNNKLNQSSGSQLASHSNSITPKSVIQTSSSSIMTTSVTNISAPIGSANPARNKPLPPSPPDSPNQKLSNDPNEISSTGRNNDNDNEVYDRELPPLPPSISPSTNTDDSQMNSLDSHQSSPATSLVSIPPPPPPISSYLEQYDEVGGGCNQANQYATSSSPAMSSGISDTSSVSQYTQQPQKQQLSFELPLPYKNQLQHFNQNWPSNINLKFKPDLAAKTELHRASHTVYASQQKPNVLSAGQVQRDVAHLKLLPPPPPPPPLAPAPAPAPPIQAPKPAHMRVYSQPSMPSSKVYQPEASNFIIPLSQQCEQTVNQQPFLTSRFRHSGNDQTISSSNADCTASEQQLRTPVISSSGFDQPDCANIRFPTPPPADLLLDGYEEKEDDDDDNEDDEDSDFQCKIPTPPPNKSMSMASFPDLTCQQRGGSQFQADSLHKGNSPPAPVFGASSAYLEQSDSGQSCLQPPPLFRQQQSAVQPNKQLRAQSQQSVILQQKGSPLQPELTVHIGAENGGLLSATNMGSTGFQNNLRHGSAINHQHQLMMTMAGPSSSPSSSSDGDGQSSNSSSSTSGIHSSIDSPSSSNSKLDDFNYNLTESIKFKHNYEPRKKHSSVLIKRHEAHNFATTEEEEDDEDDEEDEDDDDENTCKGKRQVSFATSLSECSVTKRPQTTTVSAISEPTNQRQKPKKTVSFSDKIELVACAEEQFVEHLPNPLLARVLAGQLK